MWSEGKNTAMVLWFDQYHVQKVAEKLLNSEEKTVCDLRLGHWEKEVLCMVFIFLPSYKTCPLHNRIWRIRAWVSMSLQFSKCLQYAELLKHVIDKICQQLAWSHVRALDAENHKGQTQGHQAIKWGNDNDLSVEVPDSRNEHFISKWTEQNWSRVLKILGFQGPWWSSQIS